MRSLNRLRACGEIRRFGSRPAVKPNPRNSRLHGLSTALLHLLTLSLSFFVMSV